MNARRQGVTLIETVIGIAVLALLSVTIYRGFLAILDVLNASRIRAAAGAIATEQMELIRNIPYQQIGTVGGIPSGVIPPTTSRIRENMEFLVTNTIRNIDDPFDGTLGGSPGDLSPADYKLIEIAVTCTSCETSENFIFTGRAAPRALETASTNGALFIRAIDQSGQAVAGATVVVTNTTVNPAVNITDTTDADGYLKLVDVLPAVQSYHIVVTKSGYSSDQTYASTVQNPNPTKPDATVALQTITYITFSIDRVSAIDLATVTTSCAAVANIPFQINGTALIGTNPPLLKYSQTTATDASGLKTLANLEADTYQLTFSSSQSDVAGFVPALPLIVAPGITVPVKVIMEPKVIRALLVTVNNSANGTPVTDASVTLSGGSVNQTMMTNRAFLRQTDWSGGGGQELLTDTTKYSDQDGGVAADNPAGSLVLAASSTNPAYYLASGTLTSSTFDTGSASTFHALSWQGAQPVETGIDSIRFQFASAASAQPTTWNFVGPDGTDQTYFTLSDTELNPIHDGDRYFRYRIFLHTADESMTPSVSSIAVGFTSSCVPPGQAFFSGLPSGTYTVSITRTGYQDVTQSVDVNLPWAEEIITMNPNP